MVVQANHISAGMDQIIVAMIMSNLARAGHPSRVTVLLEDAAGQQTGLKTDSIIMTDNLSTIRHNEMDRIIGYLSNMTTVDVALRHTLGL